MKKDVVVKFLPFIFLFSVVILFYFFLQWRESSLLLGLSDNKSIKKTWGIHLIAPFLDKHLSLVRDVEWIPQKKNIPLQKIVIPVKPKIDSKKLFDFVNDEREKKNLVLLKWDEKLLKSATDKVEDMCEKQYWAHTSPSGKEPWDFIKNAGFSYDKSGENLARDYINISLIINSWMNSPTHKENILNSFYRKSAIAVKECNLYGSETILVVQHFASVATTNNTGNVNNVIDSNAPIHCGININCGGGTIPLKQWECNNTTCCQLRNGSWKFYRDKDQCNRDQEAGI